MGMSVFPPLCLDVGWVEARNPIIGLNQTYGGKYYFEAIDNVNRGSSLTLLQPGNSL